MFDYRSESPEILRDFLSYHENIKGHSKKTVDEYFLDLRNFFRYIKIIKDKVPRTVELDEVSIMDVDIDLIKSVTLTDIYEYLSYLSRDRARHGNSENTAYGLNNASRARKVATLRSFYKYLTVKVHLLDENPIKDLDSPKIKRTLPKYLSLDESISLLNSVDGRFRERDYCILTLFLNCGLRISELIGLNISDIQEEALRVLGKGSKVRMVYMNDACKDSIDSYLAVRHKIVGRDRDALFLVQGRKNKQIYGTQPREKVSCRSRTRQHSVFRAQAAPYRGHSDAPERRRRTHASGGARARASQHH